MESKIKKEPFIYYLKNPVEYSERGEFVQASFLEFHEFTGNHRRDYFKLKSILTKVLMEFLEFSKTMKLDETMTVSAADSDSLDEHAGMAEALKSGLSMSGKTDPEEFLVAFESMILNKTYPLCKIDGKVSLRDAVWASLSPEEQLDAAVGYCVFFTIVLELKRKNG